MTKSDALLGAMVAQVRFWRRFAMALALGILALVVGVGIALSQLLGIAHTNRENGEAVLQIIDRFDECTTPAPPGGPPHECFELAEERSSRTAVKINCSFATDLRVVAMAITRAVGVPVPLPPLPDGCPKAG